MIEKLLNYLEMVLILVLLVGCTSRSNEITISPSTTSRSNGSVTATIQPTIQTKPFPPTPIIDPTTTVVSIDPEVQRSKDLLISPCLPIAPLFSPNQPLSQDLFVTYGNTPYIYDLNANTQMELQPLSQSAYMNYFISPDGKWVAYQDYVEGNNRISVMEIESVRKKLNKPYFQWTDPNQINLQGWFSPNSLLIIRQSSAKTNTTADDTTVILNPFTDEEHVFTLLDYPNYKYFKSGGVGNYMFGHSNLLPDPTLSRLIYPEYGHGIFLTLWDLNRQKALVRLENFYEIIMNDPLWSQDGKDLLIQNIDQDVKEYSEDRIEWFQVTSEGEIKQVTHFSKFMPKGFYLKASRSWNGQYLTFQWDYPSGEAPENRYSKYFVLNLKASSLEGFCIDAKPFSGGDLQGPVWSADNRYLAISDSSNGQGDLILIDMNKRQAYKIGKDVIARGWIERP